MIKFSVLSGCINGFTERSGGVSKGAFESLNLGFNSGDELNNVEKNIELFLESINFNGAVYYMDQVHGKSIHVICKREDGFHRVAETDGIVTDQSDVLLMSTYADCVPILFFSEEKQVVALAHSGWKGTVQGIASEMIGVFKKEYCIASETIKVAIGPSAGLCCYEVDSRVRDALSGYEEYSRYVDDEHVMLDLKKIVKAQMIECGVLESNIEVSEDCTICNEERFFSYRRSGTTGRMVSFIGLKGVI